MSSHSDPVAEANEGSRVLAYLLGGIIVYGGIGYLLDRLLRTTWIAGVGVLVGAGLGIATIVYRFGGGANHRTEERSAQ